jgi:hypothetical protein
MTIDAFPASTEDENDWGRNKEEEDDDEINSQTLRIALISELPWCEIIDRREFSKHTM